MPSASRFILKNSHPAIRELIPEEELQGRYYNEESAEEPGGIKASELILGLKLACLAITDDKPFTLQKTGKANPWQVEAMKLIACDQSHAPLTDILYSRFNLFTDHIIDVSGVTSGGHPLDTQGYIAHNDDMIVLAYRCTTSAADWLTNLTTTSSAWEIDEDVAQGHSGALSCFEGYAFCNSSCADVKPRVHTGFYNNFLATVPLIHEFIDPLLADDQPRRTLYVVGHSLGGGVANQAACYFLLEGHDWALSKHKLRVITAGSPRAVCVSMQETVHARMADLTNKDQAIFARIVRDKDVVPTVPPELFGFRHLGKLVYITKEEDCLLKGGAGKSHILINPNFDHIVPKRKMRSLLLRYPNLLTYRDDQEYPHPVETISILAQDPDIHSYGFESDSDDDELEGEAFVDSDGEEEVPASNCCQGGNGPCCAAAAADKDKDKDKDKEKHSRDMEQVETMIVGERPTEYEKRINMVPRAFRDHMPEFYLKPLMALEQECEGTGSEDAVTYDSDELKEIEQIIKEQAESEQAPPQKKKGLRSMLSRRRNKRRQLEVTVQ